jgi:hypothetical protein
VWELHNGTIPKDEYGRTYEIHHVDGDCTNNALSNLQCVSIQEHLDIHCNQEDWIAVQNILYRMNKTPHQISEENRLRALSSSPGNKGKKAWNNGERVMYANSCPGNGWVMGSLQKGKIGATADKVVWNNGIKICYSINCPGPEWTRGALKRPKAGPKRGSKRWNNGKENKVSLECPGPGWVSGFIPKIEKSKGSTTGKRTYNNGVKNAFFFSDPGGEWSLGSITKGMTSNIFGKKAWNNGKQIKYSNESPGKEWNKGSLPRGPHNKNSK